MAGSPGKLVTFSEETLDALRKASEATRLTANEIIRRGTERALRDMGVEVEPKVLKRGGRRKKDSAAS